MSEAKHTKELIDALKAVKNGADVYDYKLAKTLRKVEREFPELVSIGQPQMYSGDGTDKVPYFGAICTKKGKELIKKATS